MTLLLIILVYVAALALFVVLTRNATAAPEDDGTWFDDHDDFLRMGD